MPLHKSVVTANTSLAAKRLSDTLEGSFFLAGGTAVALQLGHRISLDLDLFSETETLECSGRERILKNLSTSGDLSVLENEDGTLHLRLNETPVSLFHYRYACQNSFPGEWEGLPIANLLDISAMKLSAVVGRGARKDFVDLYVLAKKFTLPNLFQEAVRHFPDHPNFIFQAARALTYFQDAEKEPMPRMIKSLEWKAIRQYFEREVPRLMRTWVI